jgi:hypothetical protein
MRSNIEAVRGADGEGPWNSVLLGRPLAASSEGVRSTFAADNNNNNNNNNDKILFNVAETIQQSYKATGGENSK